MSMSPRLEMESSSLVSIYFVVISHAIHHSKDRRCTTERTLKPTEKLLRDRVSDCAELPAVSCGNPGVFVADAVGTAAASSCGSAGASASTVGASMVCILCDGLRYILPSVSPVVYVVDAADDARWGITLIERKWAENEVENWTKTVVGSHRKTIEVVERKKRSCTGRALSWRCYWLLVRLVRLFVPFLWTFLCFVP